MRRFNPEKELYKIQHGNRNRILYSIIALLLIISIGSTYALYQVRYSKRIIYTKVAPFSNKDIELAIYVDGKELDKLPEKGEEYYYESITCENDPSATAEWDYTNQKLNSIYTIIPNKCDIKFVTKDPLLVEKIKYENITTESTIVDDETKDHNLRYIGKEPNNYIWFNCNNYDLVTNNETALDQKCEKWRIIGLFNNMVKEDGNTEGLIKIIRAESIGNIAWDATGGTTGLNDWTRPADLQTSLNNAYLTENDNGSWITSYKDVKYKSITSATKNMIEQVTWNLGGSNSAGSVTASRFYTAERGEITYSSINQPYIWNGYIGLMYPSDYGYAANKSCWSINLDSYNNSCYSSDWLYITNTTQWTLIACNSPTATCVYYVTTSGYVSGTAYREGYMAAYQYAIRPSLYLKSSIKVVSGDGSSNTPYILVP